VLTPSKKRLGCRPLHRPGMVEAERHSGRNDRIPLLWSTGGPQLIRRREAVHIGHHHVEQNGVIIVRRDKTKRPDPSFGLGDQSVWLVVDVGLEIIALRFKIKGAPSLPVNMAAGRAGGKGTELWAQSNPSDFKARGSWASACANDDGRLEWKTFSASRWYIASDKIAAELPAKRASNDGHRPR
jgi:hypothetical protein